MAAFGESCRDSGHILTAHFSGIPINNPQQSWGFKWEPPKAVMKDSATRDWTLWGDKLQLQLSAISGVLETKYTLAQSLWPRELRALRSTFCAIQVELFSSRYPITSSTEFRWL
jgi:hypothetical protein